MKESKLFPVAIVLTLIAIVAQIWLSRMPNVTPSTAEATEFSAERAMNLLEHLLQENQPHPVGSKANQLVKSRIVNWLEKDGIETEVQALWGCSARHDVCAWVENIIGVVPGTDPGAPYVALMAHYDSVPAAPGAGDDGAGVVAILETARAVIAGGPTPNPLLLVITDAEEVGLLGAEAFFKFHPLAEEIGVILNVEGSGSTGPSMVLRTSPGNARLMAHYRKAAEYPFGASLANEVFKRMPNDTDFSVSARANIPGIDFAFSAERNHYHTLNDNFANLNPRTVQHHGENLLPVTLTLMRESLSHADSGHVVYSEFYGQWVQWSAVLTKWLIFLTGVSLLLVARQIHGTLREIMFCTILLPLAILLAGSATAFLAFKAVDFLNGTTVGWPAHLWPFRMILFASMMTTGLIISSLANRSLSLSLVLLGGWGFWWLLALAMAFTVPDAANVLLIPLLPAVVLLLVAVYAPVGERIRHCAMLATLLCAAPPLVMSLLLEQTQGYRLIVSTFPFLALFSIAAGAFVRGPLIKPVVRTGVVLLALGLIAASVLPLYSPWRPQHVNIHYVENVDSQASFWRLQPKGPPPDFMTSKADFSLPAQSLFPWTRTESTHLAEARMANLPPPVLEVVNEVETGSGRSVQLRLATGRAARMIQLVLPANAVPLRYRIGENEVTPRPSEGSNDTGVFRLIFLGVQNRDVNLVIDFADREPVSAYLLDSATQLPPDAAAFENARLPLASPFNTGDQSMSFRRYTF